MSPERDAGQAKPGQSLRRIAPPDIHIFGVQWLPRTIHSDPRGFLLETLRSDDSSVNGSKFVMSYSSLTFPGQYRDVDRWHLHNIQTDRFVVPLGEMTLALLDGRDSSPSHGRIEVVLMRGAEPSAVESAPGRDVQTYLVTIPPGVLHCIGNLSSEPYLLQNYPTEFYNPADEGRVPFSNRVIPELGCGFSWDLVSREAEL